MFQVQPLASCTRWTREQFNMGGTDLMAALSKLRQPPASWEAADADKKPREENEEEAEEEVPQHEEPEEEAEEEEAEEEVPQDEEPEEEAAAKSAAAAKAINRRLVNSNLYPFLHLQTIALCVCFRNCNHSICADFRLLLL